MNVMCDVCGEGVMCVYVCFFDVVLCDFDGFDVNYGEGEMDVLVFVVLSLNDGV